MQLLIATSNLHKILEYKAILRPMMKVDIFSLRDFPDYTAPDEDGDSFDEIAKTKASHAAKALNLLTMADDSGLVVPALGGDPGIKSARYAGQDATDADNRKKLIKELSKLTEDERMGYFSCTIAIAHPEKGLIKTATGNCEGHLILESKGRNGFGYDPIFIKHDYSKTLAEIEPDIKNRISHRRRALDKVLLTLESELNQYCTT